MKGNAVRDTVVSRNGASLGTPKPGQMAEVPVRSEQTWPPGSQQPSVFTWYRALLANVPACDLDLLQPRGAAALPCSQPFGLPAPFSPPALSARCPSCSAASLALPPRLSSHGPAQSPHEVQLSLAMVARLSQASLPLAMFPLLFTINFLLHHI